MYGLVNRALKEWVSIERGPEAWDEVRAAAGIEHERFEDLQQYPDAMTYDLVGAASSQLGIEPEALLRAFGRHWVLFTGRTRYAKLLDEVGDDLEEFLLHLDGLHATVAESMPGLRPPSVGVESTDEGLIVTYVSERVGLEPMMLGLLEGLAESFGVKREVHWIEDSAYGEPRFLIAPTEGD